MLDCFEKLADTDYFGFINVRTHCSGVEIELEKKGKSTKTKLQILKESLAREPEVLKHGEKTKSMKQACLQSLLQKAIDW